MKVAVLQSNYIPWKGYFDIIHDVDVCVFYDDVRYTKQDWRNRNRIKTPTGARWLTIPVGKRQNRLICEVQIQTSDWAARHWRKIYQHYHQATFFNDYASLFKDVYDQFQSASLSEFNQSLIRTVCRDFLGIKTEFRDSREFHPAGQKLNRLVDLLTKIGATCYVSGPAAKNYIDPQIFERKNIHLEWKDYAGYPEYSQFFPPFLHEVSILDLLFHAGSRAPWYIWGWRDSGFGK